MDGVKIGQELDAAKLAANGKPLKVKGPGKGKGKRKKKDDQEGDEGDGGLGASMAETENEVAKRQKTDAPNSDGPIS